MKHTNGGLDCPYISYHVATKAHENPSNDSQAITESTRQHERNTVCPLEEARYSENCLYLDV